SRTQCSGDNKGTWRIAMSAQSEAKVPGQLIGVTDFFSILMPGALLAFLLKDNAGKVFGTILPKPEGELAQWITFAVASYFLGHLLHAAGSLLDWLDKSYRKRKRKMDKSNLLAIAKGLITTRYSPANGIGTAIAKVDVNNINNFSWAGSYVRVRSETAARE